MCDMEIYGMMVSFAYNGEIRHKYARIYAWLAAWRDAGYEYQTPFARTHSSMLTTGMSCVSGYIHANFRTIKWHNNVVNYTRYIDLSKIWNQTTIIFIPENVLKISSANYCKLLDFIYGC